MEVGAPQFPPQVTVMVASPATGVCVSCVAEDDVAHSAFGLIATRGEAPDTAFSIELGVPDSQYSLGASWTTSFVSIDAILAPAVAPSCSDAFWKAR